MCLGWIFASRYVDALFVGLPVLCAFVIRPARERALLLIFGGGVAAALVGFVLYTQYHAFGNAFTTPYHSHLRTGFGNDQSLSNYRFGWIKLHFWGTFVTGRFGGVRQPGDPLVREFVLLPLAPVGLVYVARATREQVRLVWLTAAIASGISTLFYLSFAAGGAHDLQFGNLRYWAPWYPLWSVLVVVCVVTLVRFVAIRGRARPPRPLRGST